MAVLKNLARMTTSTAGTGAITLGSAVAGFLSFDAAGVQDQDVITYAIQDGTASEIGRGTYTASGTTLSRSVLKSTNSNNAISLSGSAEVFITAAAEDFTDLLRADDNLAALDDAAEARVNLGIGSTKDARRNRIVNPGMVISQENGTSAGTTSGYYPVDQFSYGASHDGTISVAQVASPTPGGSPNRIRATVTSADAGIGAAEYATFTTYIEGTLTADFLWGTASARNVILRFGVKAPAGTYCVRAANSAFDRVYVAEVVISGGEANSDVVRTIVIPGDTSGTWLTTTGVGFLLQWTLASGTDYHGSAGWNGANVIATANQSNFIGTDSAVFELFDVGLYLDIDDSEMAPAWELPDHGETLRACQRYYASVSVFARWTAQGGSEAHDVTGVLPVQMRAVPALSFASTAARSNIGSASVDSAGLGAFRHELISTAAGDAYAIPDVVIANARM